MASLTRIFHEDRQKAMIIKWQFKRLRLFEIFLTGDGLYLLPGEKSLAVFTLRASRFGRICCVARHSA